MTVFVKNSPVLCPETQRTATMHELCHIKKEHFYNEEPVVYNEMEAVSVNY